MGEDKIMWDVELKEDIPDGFSVKEDADFVYLYYKNKWIATFFSDTDSKHIIQECDNFLVGMIK